MKLLFVVYRTLKDGVGISKKIKSQCRAFEENGYDVDLHYYAYSSNGDLVSCINNAEFQNYGKGKIARLKTIFNRKNLVRYVDEHKISLVYIRYEFMADYAFLLFLKLLKKKGVSVIMEIPTYPYDDELKNRSFLGALYGLLEKKYRQKMYRFVHRVVTYSNDRSIFRIPAVNISNGIDFDEIPLKEQNKVVDGIIFIGVANLGFWHGYDRLIKGMRGYLEMPCSRPIHFYIIGNGNLSYRNSLVELVEDLSMTEQVTFFDNTDGVELTGMFEKSNLAIGSLARHRSGITDLKSLKNVEYAARGIPFIYSENDSNFDDKDYVLKVPADESPIDIEELILFFESKEWNSRYIRGSIENELSWNAQIKTVIDSI